MVIPLFLSLDVLFENPTKIQIFKTEFQRLEEYYKEN